MSKLIASVSAVEPMSLLAVAYILTGAVLIVIGLAL